MTEMRSVSSVVAGEAWEQRRTAAAITLCPRMCRLPGPMAPHACWQRQLFYTQSHITASAPLLLAAKHGLRARRQQAQLHAAVRAALRRCHDTEAQPRLAGLHSQGRRTRRLPGLLLGWLHACNEQGRAQMRFDAVRGTASPPPHDVGMQPPLAIQAVTIAPGPPAKSFSSGVAAAAAGWAAATRHGPRAPARPSGGSRRATRLPLPAMLLVLEGVDAIG